MDERREISESFDEYAQELAENGGLTACDYESFEAGWKAARAQQAGSGEAVYFYRHPASDPNEWREIPKATYDIHREDRFFDHHKYRIFYTHPRASVPEGWRIQKGESVGRGDVDVVLRRNNGSAAFFRPDNDSKDALIVEFLTAMLASTTPQPADNPRLKDLTHEKCGGKVKGRHVDGDPAACLKCGDVGEVLVDDGGIDIVWPNPPEQGADDE